MRITIIHAYDVPVFLRVLHAVVERGGNSYEGFLLVGTKLVTFPCDTYTVPPPLYLQG